MTVGRTIAHIRPDPEKANSTFNARSSTRRLPWHNDCFIRGRVHSPDSFVLFCVDNSERTPTYAVELPAILESLSPSAVAALKKSEFFLDYGDEEVDIRDLFSILSPLGIRYAQGLVKSHTNPDVLVELDSVSDELVAKGIGHEYILNPGDALKVEDKRVLHGRGVIAGSDSEEDLKRHVVRVFNGESNIASNPGRGR